MGEVFENVILQIRGGKVGGRGDTGSTTPKKPGESCRQRLVGNKAKNGGVKEPYQFTKLRTSGVDKQREHAHDDL